MTRRDVYCKGLVHDDHGVSFHGCSRKAKKDGYCKQHHPDAVKARRAEQERRWARQSKIDSLGWKIRDAQAECVSLVYELARISPEAAAQAKKIDDLKAEQKKAEGNQ